MAQEPTDISSRRKKKGGAKSKEDALRKLGDQGDNGFDAGVVNPNIRTEDDSKVKRKTHRPKQKLLIEDVAPEEDPFVQSCAEEYLDVLSERMELQAKEPDLRSRLIDAMIAKGKTSTRVNGKTVTLKQLYKIETKTDREDSGE